MAAIRCRETEASNTPAVIKLLTKGFSSERSHEYWAHVITTLSAHPPPSGLPRYGYLLKSAGISVGVVLTIFSAVPIGESVNVRCNLSSCFVDPDFRSYAPLPAMRASRHKCVTYSNLSPAAHTWSILESRWFQTFATGLFIAVPILSDSVPRAHVHAVTTSGAPAGNLPPAEIQLLLDYAKYGCLSLVCQFDGENTVL